MIRWMGIVVCLLIFTCVLAAGAPDIPSLTCRHVRYAMRDIHTQFHWTKTPDRKTEVALNPNCVSSISVGKRTLLNCSSALVGVEVDGSQRILTPAYGWRINFFQQDGRIIWVGDEQKGLIALNTADFSVAKTLPKVKGQCVAVEPGGFWTMDKILPQSMPLPEARDWQWSASRLIRYNREGKEQYRFETDGKALPKGYLNWAGVDSHAVWLVGCTRWDRHHLYRLERGRAGKWHEIHLPGKQPDVPFFNAPDRLLWYDFSNTSKSASADIRHYTVYQYLKRTGAFSVCCTFTLRDGEGISVEAWDKGHLWLMTCSGDSDQPEQKAFRIRCLELRNGHFIPLQQAGTPPLRIRQCLRDLHHHSPTLSPVDGSGATVWLQGTVWLHEKLVNSPLIFSLQDDGKAYEYDLTPVSTDLFLRSSYAQPDGSIFLQSWNADTMVRLTVGHAEALAASPSENLGMISRMGGSTRLWFSGGQPYGFFTMRSDFTEQRWIPGPNAIYAGEENSAAVGEKLFFRGLEHPDLCPSPIGNKDPMVVDAESRHIDLLQSWRTQILAENPEMEWGYLGCFNTVTFPLPDGRVCFQAELKQGYDPHKGGYNQQVRSFIYDPAKDQWTQGQDDDWFTPLPTTSALYGLNLFDEIGVWRGEAWVRIGRLPHGAPSRDHDTAATNRYLYYCNGDLGLCRIAWKDLLCRR